MRAAVGAIAIGAVVVASVPVSRPLIAAGAVVGAGVAFDASVISDWKNDKHANFCRLSVQRKRMRSGGIAVE